MSAGGQLRELVRIEERECVTDPFGGASIAHANRATVSGYAMVAMKGPRGDCLGLASPHFQKTRGIFILKKPGANTALRPALQPIGAVG